MLWNINELLNSTTQYNHWGVYQYILDTKMYWLQVGIMVWIHHYFKYVIILRLL